MHMDLSIIVPLYNEEDSVTPLYDAIVKSVDRMEEEGRNIVVSWRHNRQGKLLTRNAPSRIANWQRKIHLSKLTRCY